MTLVILDAEQITSVFRREPSEILWYTLAGGVHCVRTESYHLIDADAFFAAVEERDNPEYRGKPLIIGA